MKVSFTKWLIWILAVSFYVYELVMRVFPSVMVAPLMHTFAIDAAVIGIIDSLYFYIYAPMQIPVGVLVDRFGARRLLFFAALAAGLGGIAFGFAPNPAILGISRLLMGFGSSFAFVGVVYITSHWFAHKQVAVLVGIANSLAMLGAAIGEGPIGLVEGSFGWRQTTVGLGVIGIIIGLLIGWVVNNEPPGIQKQTHAAQSFKRAFQSLGAVLSHPQSWVNALIAFAIYATTPGFAALWGVPFLQTAHALSLDEAGFATSAIYIGWIVGGPLMGYLSDKTDRRKPFVLVASFLAFLTMGSLVLFINLPLTLIIILLFLVGLFSGAEILNFAFALDLHEPEATGSAVAFTNFLVMIGGAIFQPLIGALLDLFWSGKMIGDVQLFSVRDYQFAMSIFPLMFLGAFLLSFALKETKNANPSLKKQ